MFFVKKHVGDNTFILYIQAMLEHDGYLKLTHQEFNKLRGLMFNREIEIPEGTIVFEVE